MKKNIIFLVIFSIIFSIIPVNVFAEEEYTDTEKELADELEFMFEEAIIQDSQGNPIGLNVEKIEARYGEVPVELQELQNEINKFKQLESQKSNEFTIMINPSGPPEFGGKPDRIRACMSKSVKNEWDVLISGSALGTFYGYIKGKNFIQAAKLMGKYGVKGTTLGIAGSLSAQYFKCALKS